MARFYAEIQGNRGAASRMGSAASGMTGHVRGWNIGAKVDMSADGDSDSCYVSATSGSSSEGKRVALGNLTRGADGEIEFSPSLELARALGVKAYVKVTL